MEDVLIIGGGVCGCSLLYELSRYKVKALLVEQDNDVGNGTSKANTAIVHAGYDPEPGTNMARNNVEGNRLIEELAACLDFRYKKIGSLVVGFDDTDRDVIQKLLENGKAGGVPGIRIVEREELCRMEPNVSKDALCALYAPSAGIIAPWEMVLALAECSIQSGAKIQLNTEVTGLAKAADHFLVTVKQRSGDFGTKNDEKAKEYTIEARYVVNAAGVDSDLVSRLIEKEHFAITPKRGEYYLLDTTEGNLVNHAIFPCPSKLGKGVMIAPTVHGNIIVGPDSTDCRRGETESTLPGLEYVRRCALRIVPSINFRASIRNFSGVRADALRRDFIVGESDQIPGFFNIAGIKSPGLTSAPSIARDVASVLNARLKAAPNPAFVSKRTVKRFKHMSAAEKEEAIKENPLYGTIACRCMTVTEGEILDALQGPLPPRSLDALKRRTSAGMGRCQRGFCGPRSQSIIARYFNIDQTAVPQDSLGQQIITGYTKGETRHSQGGVE